MKNKSFNQVFCVSKTKTQTIDNQMYNMCENSIITYMKRLS